MFKNTLVNIELSMRVNEIMCIWILITDLKKKITVTWQQKMAKILNLKEEKHLKWNGYCNKFKRWHWYFATAGEKVTYNMVHLTD